ncbi:MAG: shikimate kinase [Breznakibacter sp.]
MESTTGRIYLIGFMGCGKSTLGKALAQTLGWAFCDLDTLFETTYRMPISDFFKQHGEDAFREAEKEVLSQSFVQAKMVYATGGGAPCFFDNMEQMNHHGLTVYLQLPPQALMRRLQNGKQGRPLVADKPDNEMLAFIDMKLKEREPFYTQSKLIIEDDGKLSVQGYVQLILSANELQTVSRCRN